jgi:hypothetical protein
MHTIEELIALLTEEEAEYAFHLDDEHFYAFVEERTRDRRP